MWEIVSILLPINIKSKLVSSAPYLTSSFEAFAFVFGSIMILIGLVFYIALITLGYNLKKGRNWARITAIVLCTIVTIFLFAQTYTSIRNINEDITNKDIMKANGYTIDYINSIYTTDYINFFIELIYDIFWLVIFSSSGIYLLFNIRVKSAFA